MCYDDNDDYAYGSLYVQQKLARCYVYWLCKPINRDFWLNRVDELTVRVRKHEQARVQAEADRQAAGDRRG